MVSKPDTSLLSWVSNEVLSAIDFDVRIGNLTLEAQRGARFLVKKHGARMGGKQRQPWDGVHHKHQPLHDKINPKNCQVLSLGDSGFFQFLRVVSRDYGKPRGMFFFVVVVVLLGAGPEIIGSVFMGGSNAAMRDVLNALVAPGDVPYRDDSLLIGAFSDLAS